MDHRKLRSAACSCYELIKQSVRQRSQASAAAEVCSLGAGSIPGLCDARARDTIKYCLHRNASEFPEKERVVLEQALPSSPALSLIYSMRHDLTALWSQSSASTEQLVRQLEECCRRAEKSGIDAPREFSRTLRCYDSLLVESD